MKKFNRLEKIIFATLCASIFSPNFLEIPSVEAKPYKSSSDTGASVLDYIENRRLEKRANALTDEQKKLIVDVEENKERLPHKINPGEPIPAVFEGDDMVYNAVTGEFTATGKVDIVQLDGHRFQSEKARGNIKTQDIVIDDLAHVLQLTQGAPRVTLDGYHTFYNYGTKTGTMESAKGKYENYYISGKKFEFYPDHIVVHDATQTKCNAKVPDYHLSAERMEIWPEKIIRMYNVKFWIKNKVVGKKSYEESRMDDSGESYFPVVGYGKEHGAYIEDSFEIPFIKDQHFQTVLNAHIETKRGVRSNGEVIYGNRNFNSRIVYGYYCDSNDKWVMKEPSWKNVYQKHFDNMPVTYRLQYEVGRWRQENTKSTHQEFYTGLSHDPIIFSEKYFLFLNLGYKITHDNSDQLGNKKATKSGMVYDATVLREFDDRFAMYASYHYEKSNTQNSLFDFGLDNYSRKVQTGISYRITPTDRIVAGLSFDTEENELKDIDYYWYHDLHCSTAVLRWRQKRRDFGIHWQFNPW